MNDNTWPCLLTLFVRCVLIEAESSNRSLGIGVVLT